MKAIIFSVIGSLAILFSTNIFSCDTCGVQSCYADYSCDSAYSYWAGYGSGSCGAVCNSCNGGTCNCTDPYCRSVDNTCMSCSTCCNAFGNVGWW